MDGEGAGCGQRELRREKRSVGNQFLGKERVDHLVHVSNDGGEQRGFGRCAIVLAHACSEEKQRAIGVLVLGSEVAEEGEAAGGEGSGGGGG